MFEGLGGTHPPALALHKQTSDEVFGFLRDVRELLLLKVPLTGQNIVQGLVVVVPQKRRQATEPGQIKQSREKSKLCLYKKYKIPTVCYLLMFPLIMC